MNERLSLSSDRQDDRDATLRALDGYLRAWDDRWGYGGRLETAPGTPQKGPSGAESLGLRIRGPQNAKAIDNTGVETEELR